MRNKQDEGESRKGEYKKREKIKLWGGGTNNRKTTKEGFLLTLPQGIYKGRKREKHMREGGGIVKKVLDKRGKAVYNA